MNVLSSYRLSILLVISIVAGSAVGHFAPGVAAVIKPLGDLFLNLIFMIIVPLVFFSVASSIASSRGSTVSRVSWMMLLVFLMTSLVAAVTSLVFLLFVQPAPGAGIALKGALPVETPSLLVQLVKTFTVPSFPEMLSHRAMLPLMIFSAAVGIATRQLGAEGEPLARVLRSGSQVAMRLIDYVMLVAPIGLFAYFAATVAETGAQLAGAYTKLFIAYYLFGTAYFFLGFSGYAWLAGGRNGVKRFWSNMLAPSLTALGTCSSMATVPVNLEAAPRMGVPREVSDLVIPVGAVLHKDGSVIGGVVKVLFALSLFHLDLTSGRLALAIGVSILVGVVIGAIPSGGMIAEIAVLTIFGMSLEALPLLVVISVIIDPLATLLNSTGDNVAAMMVSRAVRLPADTTATEPTTVT
ncbi:dicarboxylate/amino acid:cation symporter [Geomesophilobacter sediminis]|uniref:Dicarboxylate/amino acid:cation symporter n=1 Tax=Geomesophilobacter sediminis TaxID=2798584 RepID=A0A8J7J0Q9_9BACT|nr:dicarboxylate/amino acid:cation symporter [Geomesophilobacter sediminis]MBJ6724018.1 dicarboxylate/amino acid:cation symporter [Geomesophilobacter sediminis]